MTTSPTLTNAADAYLRVSTESQVDGYGLDNQRADVERAAAADGVTIRHWHIEEGVSGAIEDRPALADAIDAEAGTLYIPRLDRLARDLIVQESILRDLWRRDVDVRPAAEAERPYCQPDDQSDPSRTLIRQMLGAVAQYERSMIAARLKAGRRRKLAETGYAGGPEPYALTNADEKRIIRSIHCARQDRARWRDIVDALNDMGDRRRNGKPWTIGAASEIYQGWLKRQQPEAATLL